MHIPAGSENGFQTIQAADCPEDMYKKCIKKHEKCIKIHLTNAFYGCIFINKQSECIIINKS